MVNQKRLLTENGQAAIWYVQSRYPFSLDARQVAAHLRLTDIGTKRILNRLAAGGFLDKVGGRYAWKKQGLRTP